MFLKFSLILFVFCLNYVHPQGALDLINDDDLLEMIRSEKYTVVLFSKRHNADCLKYETLLMGLKEDFKKDLNNAAVVKVENSQLTRLYSPNKEPALVFFRHGIPLLYDGPLNSDLIIHTFTQNIEPVVKELTDETFEHLTQAASGATTGDWFVMFYTNDCVDCQRIQARLEAVGARLKNRVNVARVNMGGTGAATAARFEIKIVPTFILFRNGKMYRYMLQKYDVNSFVSFAQDWYKNATPETVPVPKTPFDLLTTSIANYLKDNQWVWLLGIASFGIGILGSVILSKVKATPVKSKKAKKDKKK